MEKREPFASTGLPDDRDANGETDRAFQRRSLLSCVVTRSGGHIRKSELAAITWDHCDMFVAESVNKQRGGSMNEQSMAEAIAKHLKDYLHKE